jgi:hypothetical protein
VRILLNTFTLLGYGTFYLLVRDGDSLIFLDGINLLSIGHMIVPSLLYDGSWHSSLDRLNIGIL